MKDFSVKPEKLSGILQTLSLRTYMKQKPKGTKGAYKKMQGQKPIKKYRSGSFELAFWENERAINDSLVSFQTMSLSKSYKKKGEDIWRSEVIHIRRMDLPKILVLLQKGMEDLYLVDNDKDDVETEE